jgi:hypothetical protein
MVLRKVSELNYEIISNDNKKQIVHVNRQKKCYNRSLWNPRNTAKRFPKRKAKRRNSSEGEEEEIRIGKFPLEITDDPIPETECRTPPSANFDTPDRANVLLTLLF